MYVAAQPNPEDVGRVVGSDFAGTVDQVGEDVTQWKVGDRVTGFVQGGMHSTLRFLDEGVTFLTLATSVNPRPGGFAEYAILEADLAIRIPTETSFEEAATFPLCSLTAAQVSILPRSREREAYYCLNRASSSV